MSERSVSTPGAPVRLNWRSFAAPLAVSAVVTALILVLAAGPAGLQGLTRLVATASWTPHWPSLSPLLDAALPIKLHVAAVSTALAIGVTLMSGVKGTTVHRALGWIWVGAMSLAAISSVFIRELRPGNLSFLHLFAGWTLVALPIAVVAARRHKVRTHARFMTGLFVGGLIVAGATSFVPGRLMWRLFFG